MTQSKMQAGVVGLALLLATAAGAEQAPERKPAAQQQEARDTLQQGEEKAVLFVTVVYKLTAYSPSRGQVGTREVAVVGANLNDCNFKVTLIQNAYLTETCGKEVGAVVTREILRISH